MPLVIYIYVGQLQKVEIDFVAERSGSTIYVQVREFGNLLRIKNSHPKYVVSMDAMSGLANIDGVKHVHLRDFLQMGEL